jgi:hypothetical protein
VSRLQRDNNSKITALDALVLGSLPLVALISRLAAARRSTTVSRGSSMNALRLGRLIFPSLDEQYKFLQDIDAEVERQGKKHAERRRRRGWAGLGNGGRGVRVHNVAMAVFGHPTGWIGNLGRPFVSDMMPTYWWIRIVDDTAVAGLSVTSPGLKTYAFVYKSLSWNRARYVAIPAQTTHLNMLLELLGLHSRTRELAQFVIDWKRKRFKINGLDTIPWNFT